MDEALAVATIPEQIATQPVAAALADTSVDVYAYVQYAETLPADERAAVLSQIRHTRGGIESSYAYAAEKAVAARIDDAIIALVENGNEAAAFALMRPTMNQGGELYAAWAERYPGTDTNPILDRLEALQADKDAMFDQALAEYGSVLGDERLRKLRAELKILVGDPEGVFSVPVSFWQDTYDKLPDEARMDFLGTKALMAPAAETMSLLQETNMLSYTEALLGPASAIEDPTKRRAYVEACVRALDMHDIAKQDNFALRQLALYQNPDEALGYVEQLIDLGLHTYLDLANLTSCLDLYRQTGPPYEITQADVDAIARCVATLEQHGFAAYSVPYLVRGLLALDKAKGPIDRHAFLDAIALVQSSWQEQVAGGRTNTFDPPISAKSEIANLLSDVDTLLTPEGQRKALLFVQKAHMSAQIGEFLYETILRDRDEQEDVPAMEFDTIPALGQIFDALGIPAEMRPKLFTAWCSQSATLEALYIADTEELSEVTDEQIEQAVKDKTAIIYEQVTALQTYVEKYGAKEAARLHKTFGIVNFVRAEPEEFHDQLVRWEGQTKQRPWYNKLKRKNEPKEWRDCEPPKHIKATATESYNIAFRKDASEFFKEFGTEGSFYFEVSDVPAITKVAIAVGDRERSAWRDPIRTSSVEDFMIGGHGNPTEVALSHEHSLEVRDYVQGILHRNRLADDGFSVRSNTYERHLGTKFRILLHACSAAARSEFTYSLTQIMGAQHSKRAEGASMATYGYTKKEDGSIEYHVRDADGQKTTLPSVVYHN